MDKYTVVLSEPAFMDMQKISDYIACDLQEPVIAKRQLERITDAMVALAEFPMRYALVIDNNLATKGYRMFTVDNYIVFYIVSNVDNTVSIDRILFKRRDWLSFLQS